MPATVACRLRVIGTEVRAIFDIEPNIVFTHKLRRYRSATQVDAAAITLVHMFSEITHTSTRLRAAFLQWVVRARYDAQIDEDVRTLTNAVVRGDVASVVHENEDQTMRKRMCVLDNMATIHGEMVAIARSYRLDNCIMRRRVNQMQRTVDEMQNAFDAEATSIINENETMRLENAFLQRRLREFGEVASPILYV